MDIGQGVAYKNKTKSRPNCGRNHRTLSSTENHKRISATGEKTEQQMYQHAQALEFEKAATIRDQLHQLHEQFRVNG